MDSLFNSLLEPSLRKFCKRSCNSFNLQRCTRARVHGGFPFLLPKTPSFFSMHTLDTLRTIPLCPSLDNKIMWCQIKDTFLTAVELIDIYTIRHSFQRFLGCGNIHLVISPQQLSISPVDTTFQNYTKSIYLIFYLMYETLLFSWSRVFF